MRNLVTGGAGFVGSHLCESLISLGEDVVCIDNLSTGRVSNIQHLLGSPLFSFRLGDVTEPLDAAVDRIYNLACPASPVAYQAIPIATMKTNVWGAFNLLELARSSGARILQASTSEVYGDPLLHPQSESYWGHVNPIGIRSCYDEGKRAAESLFFDYQRVYSSDIKVARIFNTYGPRMRGDDGRVVSNFIVQALRGEALTVFGTGLQTRSFCFVDDLVRGLMAMMNSPARTHGPVNLGNPTEFTILELVGKLEKVLGHSLAIQFEPLPQDDPAQRRPDIAAAKRLLGWSPITPLEEGLAKVVEYFRSVEAENKTDV